MSRNILTGGGGSGGGGGAVASVTGTAPITSTGGVNPAIGIVPSSAITAGSMSAADFSKLAGLPTFPALTQGSVLFAGPAGAVAQDNANFFFDDALNRLGLGTTTPAQQLHATANARVDGRILAADGTALAPSITFTSDTGSGLSHLAPDGVAISDGGLYAMTLRVSAGVGFWQFPIGGLNLRDIGGTSILTAVAAGAFRLDNTNVTQLLIPDGNGGAPGLAFTSSPTSGFYNGGLGAIRVQTSGILRARFGEGPDSTELDQPTSAAGGGPTILRLVGAPHTGLTSEAIDEYLQIGRTITYASGVNMGAHRSVFIEQPTLAGTLPAGAAVSGNAATLSIQGAPIQGANMTLNNAYALDIEDGGASIINVLGNAGVGGGPGGVLGVSMRRSGVGLAANNLNLGMSLDVNGDPLDNAGSILIGSLAGFSRNGSPGMVFGYLALVTPGESLTGSYMAASDVSPNIIGRTTTGDPIPASTESTWIRLDTVDPLAPATWTAGALATQRFVVVAQPTIAFSGPSTVSDCATFAVANAPAAGANATITRAYSVWSQEGLSLFERTLGNGTVDSVMHLNMKRSIALTAGSSDATLVADSLGVAGDSATSFLNGQFSRLTRATSPAIAAAFSAFASATDSWDYALLSFSRTPCTIGRTSAATLPASTESPWIQLRADDALGISTTFGTGALATQRFVVVTRPTIAFAAASTVTNCATLAIANSPAAGAFATITNAYALWVQAGITRLEGALQAAGGISLPTFTQGSVLFAGAAGAVTQDNANLFYDPTLNRLNVGNNAATQTGGTFNAEGDIGNVAGFGYVIGSLMDRTAGPAGAGNGVVNFYFDLEGNAADNATAFLNGNFAFLNKNGSAAQAAALSANGDQFDYTVTAFAQHLILGAQTAAAGAGFDSRLLASNGLTAGNGGNILISAGLHAGTATDGTVTVNNLSALAVTQGAQVLGAPSAFKVTAGASTGQTASTEVVDIDFALNRTLTHANGAIATQRSAVFRAPTHTFPGPGAQTITNCATVAITGAPITGANANFTNAYALWSQSANDLCQFEGPTALGRTAGDVTMGIDVEGNAQVHFFASTLQFTFALGAVQGGTFSVKPPDLDTFQGGEIAYFKAPVLTNQSVGGGTNELIEVRVDLDNINQFITGAAVNTQRSVLITPRTFTGTAATQTITDCAVVAISAPSIAGTNCAITNNASFWVQAGNVALGAMTGFGGGSLVMSIHDRTTAPTTNPTAGGILYSNSGALTWRGSSGTVTAMAPA